MIWAIIFLTLSIIAFGLLLWCTDSDGWRIIFFGGLCMIVVGASCGILHNTIAPTPTALDVYRGKTTLEITYRDSVAVDSIVVYKVR